MNKKVRFLLKHKNFIKRLKQIAMKFYKTSWFVLIKKPNMQVYRETGRPYSCWDCKQDRYSKKDRQNLKKDLYNKLKNH